MNDRSARLARASRYPSIRGLFPYALCLRAGIVGLIAAGGGVAALVDGTGAAAPALAWLAAGAALAAYSWRRLVAAMVPRDVPIRDDETAQAQGASEEGVRLAAAHHATEERPPLTTCRHRAATAYPWARRPVSAFVRR